MLNNVIVKLSTFVVVMSFNVVTLVIRAMECTVQISDDSLAQSEVYARAQFYLGQMYLSGSG